MMTKGVEMMIMSIIRMIGIDPEWLKGVVVEINKSLHTVADQASHAARDAAIARRNSEAIMQHLGLTPTQDVDDGQHQFKLDGPVAGNG